MRSIVLLIILLASFSASFGQQVISGQDTNRRVITTAVPFLLISPDARSGALGDAGAALSPDANSAHWNPAKMAFLKEDMGAAISATPWLGKIINDMMVYYLSGYYKLSRQQTISASMRYFDLGDITFTSNGQDQYNFNPREISADVTFAQMLSDKFSIGVTGKYIYSNMVGNYNTTATDPNPGSSIAADIGTYYTTDLILSGSNSNLALAAVISNIGQKITYSDESRREFIPVNLRIGGAFTTELDPYNTITILVDFNKLMVPTLAADSQEKPLLSGMFQSFNDAPGGFKEELNEINIATGVEYWYDKLFAARAGYFYEATDKGNRKFFTAGVGFKYNVMGFDFAYLIPQIQNHPLAETIRITLHFDMNKPQITPELPVE